MVIKQVFSKLMLILSLVVIFGAGQGIAAPCIHSGPDGPGTKTVNDCTGDVHSETYWSDPQTGDGGSIVVDSNSKTGYYNERDTTHHKDGSSDVSNHNADGTFTSTAHINPDGGGTFETCIDGVCDYGGFAPPGTSSTSKQSGGSGDNGQGSYTSTEAKKLQAEVLGQIEDTPRGDLLGAEEKVSTGVVDPLNNKRSAAVDLNPQPLPPGPPTELTGKAQSGQNLQTGVADRFKDKARIQDLSVGQKGKLNVTPRSRSIGQNLQLQGAGNHKIQTRAVQQNQFKSTYQRWGSSAASSNAFRSHR